MHPGLRPCLVLLLACAPACLPKSLGGAAIVQPIRLPRLSSPALRHENVVIPADDGVELSGWLFRPEGPSKGLIVYLHGKDNHRGLGALAAERFVPQGYTVLAYDHRGHGLSTGELCTFGHYEKEDLRKAIDFVKLEPVYVVGHSLGAATALQAAPADARIRAVVAVSSFSDLNTIIDERSPFFAGIEDRKGAIEEAERRGNFKISEISPRASAAQIKVPVLLVHGKSDTFTSADHSKRIYDALPGQKRLIGVDGAGHEDVLTYPQVWSAIDRWLRDVAATTAPASPSGPNG